MLAAGVLVSGWLILRESGARGGLTPQQECGLVTGGFGFFAVLGFFQELNPTRTDNPAGMSLVGASTLLLLYYMWKRAANVAAAVPHPDFAVAMAGGGAVTSAGSLYG